MSRIDDTKSLERAPAVGLNAARWSVSTIFLLNGAGIGVWAAHVPLVQARAGIDTGVLGFLLLTIAGGAISAMPLSGWMAGRWGTRAVVVGSGLLFALMSAVLMNVGGLVPLFLAAYVFGASNGVLDVAMNANASEVEAARGIPTMSSFHGFYSLGGLIGAALGGLLIGAGLGDGRGALMVSAAIFAAVLACGGRLLAVPPAPHASHFALPRGPALFLGLLALLCFAIEGALVDWSALLLKERTQVDAATAALGYSAFSVTMAACRFAGDRLVLRFGPLRVMIVGGLGMFAGLMLAVVSTQFWLSALGLALIGLAAANVVPLIFAAAARMPGMSAGGGLATVATLGYAGLLMAPPLLGAIAAHTNIAMALGILSLSGIVIAANARRVRP
ncbi:MFS transporter [Telluria mixta]|uniref:MFS transporter n=1 Tax=Telluria mixta TaxID=34071 RepID=A0ABT2C2F9_9BURK|nr:MFS transporter [Telluria mixta]MCS0631571.1 MFS transporter [Telluria mixta]WEM98324.1 MFS transporter [Telluria mixta]